MRGITDGGLKPRRIKKIAVLGGGLMGSGIATASALAGIDVLLKEVNQKFLEVLSRSLPSHAWWFVDVLLIDTSLQVQVRALAGIGPRH